MGMTINADEGTLIDLYRNEVERLIRLTRTDAVYIYRLHAAIAHLKEGCGIAASIADAARDYHGEDEGIDMTLKDAGEDLQSLIQKADALMLPVGEEVENG